MQACPVCSTTRSPEGMNRHLDICLIRGGGEVGGGGGGGGANLLQACPVCATLLPPEAINTHLDTCLTSISANTDTSISTSTSTIINTNINTSISASTSTNTKTSISPSQNSKYTVLNPTNKATISNIKGKHEKRPLENPNIKVERKKRRVAAPPPLPECPVCFEAMAPPVQIHQCGLGHLVCGGCRPRVEECPSRCGHPMVARAIGMEQYVRELHEQMG